MKAIIEDIFGVYTPFTDGSGEIIKGVSGVDFEYLCGVALFALVLYSVFRLVGILFKR